MWDVLKMEKWLVGKAGAGCYPQFSVTLAASTSAPANNIFGSPSVFMQGC